MEIVEGIGTSDEHADPFYRWNNYGIELHEDGLCQAYVIIQDPEEGELPKKIAEGFDSPEAVIEYFRNTEHQKELAGEGVAPEEVAEAEGEPAPMGDPGALDGPAEEMPPVEEAPAENTPEAEPPVEEEEAPAPEKKEGEGGEKDKKEDEEKDDKDKKDEKKVKKSEEPAETSSESIQKAVPEEADPFPPIKSFAEIREEYMKSHAGSGYNASTPAEHTRTTITKTAQVNKMTETNTTASIAKSESTPVKKSIKFGEIPSWQDIKNGYQFVPEAPAASITKSEAAGSPPPEQVPEDVPAEMPPAEAPAEAPAESGDLTPEEIQALAQALGMSPEEIQQMLANPESAQQLLQMISEVMPEEGEPAVTDDGLKHPTSTPDIGL